MAKFNVGDVVKRTGHTVSSSLIKKGEMYIVSECIEARGNSFIRLMDYPDYKLLASSFEIVSPCNNLTVKPPLGLVPKEMYYENISCQRKKDIEQAILRYIQAGLDVPSEWLYELLEMGKNGCNNG